MTGGRDFDRRSRSAQRDAAAIDGAAVRARALQDAAGNQVAAGIFDAAAPLAPVARQTLERVFGVDLGDLRLHGGLHGEEAAAREGAAAVTKGDDLYVPPRAATRKVVIAHELAHAIQQAQAPPPEGFRSSADLETEAGNAAAGGELTAAPHGAAQHFDFFGLLDGEEEKTPKPDAKRIAFISDRLRNDPEQWRELRMAPEFPLALQQAPDVAQRLQGDPEYGKWVRNHSYVPAASQHAKLEGEEQRHQEKHPLPAASKDPGGDWKSSFERNATLTQRGQRAGRRRVGLGEYYGEHERILDAPIPILEMVPGGKLARLGLELGHGEKVSGRRVDRLEKAKEFVVEAGLQSLQFIGPEAEALGSESGVAGRELGAPLLGETEETLLNVRSPAPVTEPIVDPAELHASQTSEAAASLEQRGIELPEAESEMVIEGNEAPHGTSAEARQRAIELPEVEPETTIERNETPHGTSAEAEQRAESFTHSSDVDPARAPRGFESGRATPGRNVRPGGLEGLESHSFGGGLRARSGLQGRFMDTALDTIAADPNHKLRFLLAEDGTWLSRTHLSELPTVQAGHLTSFHSGAPEALALEDSFFNQLTNWRGETQGATFFKTAVDIDGVAVEWRTAMAWEKAGLLPKGTVADAAAHSGWTGAP